MVAKLKFPSESDCIITIADYELHSHMYGCEINTVLVLFRCLPWYNKSSEFGMCISDFYICMYGRDSVKLYTSEFPRLK